ncbi:MAG: hypothetical protein IPK64_02480 [bacterium]|nr:hypothetical protein [bacterium]
MADTFAGPNFQALGLEMWGGNLSQTNSFISVTGVSYPVLMGAAAAGIGASYACTYDVFFVVGGDGLITFRRSGWNEALTSAAISAALADLVSGVPPLARDGFLLRPAYPNPFNPATSLSYRLDGEGTRRARLRILDLQGRLLRTLVDETQPAGADYTVLWDGRDDRGLTQASGSYLVDLAIDGVSQSRLATLVK